MHVALGSWNCVQARIGRNRPQGGPTRLTLPQPQGIKGMEDAKDAKKKTLIN